MVLRCLRAELMKCRRAPVWLAFLVLPLFPAVLGTFNYLGNLEVLDAGWRTGDIKDAETPVDKVVGTAKMGDLVVEHL